MKRYHGKLLAGALLLAAVGPGHAQGDITPPAPPPPMPAAIAPPDAQLLSDLSEQERLIVQKRTDARGRFEALLEVSDLRLAGLREQFAAGGNAAVRALRIYEAVLLVADRTLRSPEAKVLPRDKRFKQFEKKLTDHFARLKGLTGELDLDALNTGEAVLGTVKRLKVAALHSALDVQGVLEGGS